MPRDSSGNYTLPAGTNPVVSNTLIDVDWANPTLNDIATQLNNVLTRDGLLSPIGPFLAVDGSVTQPGLAFNSQTNTGFYRPAATNAIGVAVQGSQIGQWSGGGLAVTGSLTTTLDLGVGSGTASAAGLGIGNSRTVDGPSYIDLVGATGNPDYNLRIARDAGVNGTSIIRHTGTGPFIINNEGAASWSVQTSGIERLAIAASGAVNIAGGLTVGGSVAPARTGWYSRSITNNWAWSADDGGPGPLCQFQGSGTLNTTLNVGSMPIGTVIEVALYSFSITGKINAGPGALVYVGNSGISQASITLGPGVGRWMISCVNTDAFVVSAYGTP